MRFFIVKCRECGMRWIENELGEVFDSDYMCFSYGNVVNECCRDEQNLIYTEIPDYFETELETTTNS